MEDMITVDYYQGTYGPTIIIIVPSKEMLLFIRDTFRKLAMGKLSEVKFQDIPFINFIMDLNEFNLRVVPKLPSSIKTVEVTTKEGKTVAEWVNDPEGWKQCDYLLEGFFVKDIPSHQYLEKEIDDTIIEVSYREKMVINNLRRYLGLK